MKFPGLCGKVPLEDESNIFAKPGARESNVAICIVAVGGVRSSVWIVARVGVILLEQVDRLFSGFSIVVGWPREILVRSFWRDTEEVMSLHHSSGEAMDRNCLKIGRRRNEVKDVIDAVLLDVGGIHLWWRVDRGVSHSGASVLIRRERVQGRDIVAKKLGGEEGSQEES